MIVLQLVMAHARDVLTIVLAVNRLVAQVAHQLVQMVVIPHALVNVRTVQHPQLARYMAHVMDVHLFVHRVQTHVMVVSVPAMIHATLRQEIHVQFVIINACRCVLEIVSMVVILHVLGTVTPHAQMIVELHVRRGVSVVVDVLDHVHMHALVDVYLAILVWVDVTLLAFRRRRALERVLVYADLVLAHVPIHVH